MARIVYIAAVVFFLGLVQQEAKGAFMQKLSKKKLCADDECIYAISLGKAEDDYNAPDCRFINVKKGELIFIYTKLVKDSEDAGEFWAGSVYSDQYKDQMGIGYFPSNLVTELAVYKDTLEELPTVPIDFYCD